MGAWLSRMWNDEAAFDTAVRTLGRGAVALLGYLVQQGVIPTGIDGGGGKFGPLLMALAFFVPAGQRNPAPPANG